MAQQLIVPRVLECGICCEVFTPEGSRCPMLLVCGHSVCATCLPSLRDMCPFCNEPSPPPAKKNFTLIDQLQLLSEVEASFTARCETGNHEGAVIATLYCDSCGLRMCESCSVAVHTVMKGHTISLVQQQPQQARYCKEHNERLKYVCLESACKPDPVMCTDCRDYGKHKNHRHDLIKSVVETRRREMQQALDRTLALHAEAQAMAHRVAAISAELEPAEPGGPCAPIQHAQALINDHINRLQVALEHRRQELMRAVDAEANSQRRQLHEKTQQLAGALSGSNSATYICRTALQSDDVSIVQQSGVVTKSIGEAQQHLQAVMRRCAGTEGGIPINFSPEGLAEAVQRFGVVGRPQNQPPVLRVPAPVQNGGRATPIELPPLERQAQTYTRADILQHHHHHQMQHQHIHPPNHHQHMLVNHGGQWFPANAVFTPRIYAVPNTAPPYVAQQNFVAQAAFPAAPPAFPN